MNGTWTDWQDCGACEGDDRNCFSCGGDGGEYVRVARCDYCPGDARMYGDSSEEGRVCSDCAWEMA